MSYQRGVKEKDLSKAAARRRQVKSDIKKNKPAGNVLKALHDAGLTSDQIRDLGKWRAGQLSKKRSAELVKKLNDPDKEIDKKAVFGLFHKKEKKKNPYREAIMRRRSGKARSPRSEEVSTRTTIPKARYPLK